MAETINQWQVKRDRLHEDHEKLERNVVFKELMKACALTAAVLDRQAGDCATDREMNQKHGQAKAYRDMLMLVPELVGILDAQYEQKQVEEELEEFGADPDADPGRGLGNYSPRQEAGSVDPPVTRKERRRRRPAKVEDVSDLGGAGE